ncbi:MAG: SAM-dependent methyltransferase [Peptococcaceae bacterium]|nr:SAM-dependent methyltransferase [Peptococcaceae bacterium]
MELSPRLLCIAHFVPPGKVVADIGTDHALLPVYLIKTGRVSRVIGVEKAGGPLAAARLAVTSRGFEGFIDVRCGDGLTALKPGEAQVIVLAGMGGHTIKEILAKSPGVRQAAERLVMQPMAQAGALRLWLAGHGWRIVDEELVRDGGRLFQVIVAEPGKQEVDDQLLQEIGPRLVAKKHPLLKEYLAGLLRIYEKILTGLQKSNRPEAREKAGNIQDKMAKLEEILACL